MDLKMKIKNWKLMAVSLVMAVSVLGTTQAFAQENGGEAAGTAEVTVDNSVTVVETTAMDFGSIVIMTDGVVGNLDVVMTAGGVMTWPAAGGATTVAGDWLGLNPNGLSGGGVANNARVFPTGALPQVPAVYDLTGGAADAAMGILYNNGTLGAPIDSTLLSPCGGANLTVTAFTDNSGGDSIIELSAAGAFTLNVGATLRVNRAAGDNRNPNGNNVLTGYCDGNYVGPMIVSAVY